MNRTLEQELDFYQFRRNFAIAVAVGYDRKASASNLAADFERAECQWYLVDSLEGEVERLMRLLGKLGELEPCKVEEEKVWHQYHPKAGRYVNKNPVIQAGLAKIY